MFSYFLVVFIDTMNSNLGRLKLTKVTARCKVRHRKDLKSRKSHAPVIQHVEQQSNFIAEYNKA